MKLLGALTITLLLLLVACGQPAASPTTTPGTSPEPPGSPGLLETAIDIIDFAYQPDTEQVSAGGQVVWTNAGNAPHTVTFDDGTVDSGNISAGGTFEHTFNAAGAFQYHCTIHPQMVGTVTVGP
ncbi:hypothetical protein BH23CHL7_BH23CHL7_08880 [soil metagenome]